MSLTLSQGSQNYIKLRHHPWIGNPTEAPAESPTIPTYEGEDEKIKLRKNANGGEYLSPVVELTKGAKVALLDGENRMSLVSTIVDGKVCSGWIPTAYLH